LLDSPDKWHDPEIQGYWISRVSRRNNLHVLYQTPAWFDHLHQTAPRSRVVLAVARDRAGDLAGLAPLRITSYELGFHLLGKMLGKFSFLKLWLLGGPPLLPETADLYDSLFATLDAAFPECQAVGFGGIPEGGFLWRHLLQSAVVRRHFLPYLVDGVRSLHTVPLPGTFDEYLAQFGHKRRYNLKRQVRVLQDHCGGGLRLERVDSEEGVPAFVEATAELGRTRAYVPETFFRHHDRAAVLRKFADAAARGLLRSYVLHCGPRAAGCIFGLQHEDVYHIHWILHSQELGRFSPGAVLLYLAVEDMIRHRPVRLVNFGFGEPAYKLESTNVCLSYGTLLLLRNTLGNHARRWAHSRFHSAVYSGKRVLACVGLKKARWSR
jgi:hypothetical protein